MARSRRPDDTADYATYRVKLAEDPAGPDRNKAVMRMFAKSLGMFTCIDCGEAVTVSAKKKAKLKKTKKPRIRCKKCKKARKARHRR